MKGLLIKDYYLLLQQKTFSFLVICMVISFGISSGNITFALSFIMFVFSLLACNTISYDDYNHGYTFLFTLPVTRKTYVKEKYVLSILTCLAGWLIGCGMALVTMSMRNTVQHFPEILSFSLFLLPVFLLFQCIDIPVQLKFGSENGRNIRFLISGGIVLVILFLSKLPVFHSLNTIDFSQITVSPVLFISFAIIFSIVCLILSYACSRHIMMKKEF